jgi:hypothetical protein
VPAAYVTLCQLLYGPADPEPRFYETSSQVAAAVLLAVALQAVIPPAPEPRLRRVEAGAAVGQVFAAAAAMAAALTAVGRGDGSPVLFTLTVSGLASVLPLLLATAATRALRGIGDADR